MISFEIMEKPCTTEIIQTPGAREGYLFKHYEEVMLKNK